MRTGSEKCVEALNTHDRDRLRNNELENNDGQEDLDQTTTTAAATAAATTTQQ